METLSRLFKTLILFSLFVLIIVGTSACTPTQLPPNSAVALTYIKSVSLYPQCGNVMQVGVGAQYPIVIDFIQPMNPSTMSLSSFALTGTVLYPPGVSSTVSGSFTNATWNTDDTELTLWVNPASVASDPNIEFMLFYQGSNLQTNSGISLVGPAFVYSFASADTYGLPVALTGYDMGQGFGAAEKIFWGPSFNLGYILVPPHYPITVNFSRILHLGTQIIFEQGDNSNNLTPVVASQYTGYADIMLGNWQTTPPTVLPYTFQWPGAQPFSYTIASSNGLNIDTVYQLTFPTVHCNMPNGLVGNQDLSGYPLEDSNHNMADTVIPFRTSSVSIDNPISDNVNIPTITSPFYITGTGTANVATVTITASTYTYASIPVAVVPTSSGVTFSSGDLNTAYMEGLGLVTFIAKGYDSANNYLGSDIVEVNYQGSLPSNGGTYNSCSHSTGIRPTVTISSPTANSTECPTFTVAGTFTDNSTCGIRTITVNGVNASFPNSSAGSFSATVPLNSSGNNKTITVVITDGANQQTTLSEQINVTAPSVTAVTPGAGLPESTVTITGNCFSTVKTNNVVTFSGYTGAPIGNRLVTTNATVSNASQISLTVVVPQYVIGGSNNIDVKVNGVDAGKTLAFTVYPTIYSVVNSCGGIYYINGGGLYFSDTVESETSGLWSQIGKGFVDAGVPTGGSSCTPCDQLAGTCVGSLGVYFDKDVEVPYLAFSSCGGNVGYSLPIRIQSGSYISNINSTATIHAGGSGCPSW